MPELHQHGSAARPVVGAEKYAIAPFYGIDITVRVRPRVVVSAKQNSFHALRMPLNNDIRHRDLAAAERIVCHEPLEGNISAELLEKVLEHRLLFLHSG